MANGSSFARGATVTVTGQDWVPSETVSITVHSTPINLGTLTVRADGSLPPTSFTVPADFEVGTHTVSATGSVSGTAQTTFAVAAGKGTVGTGGSIVSGFGLAWWLVAASALVAAILLRRYATGRSSASHTRPR